MTSQPDGPPRTKNTSYLGRVRSWHPPFVILLKDAIRSGECHVHGHKVLSAYAVDDLVQDERGITRSDGPFIAAWFKDPAGNIPEVLQER